ncbi:hypothetical protein BH23CHL1_BH23CHL1_26870 [soil metagenome]
MEVNDLITEIAESGREATDDEIRRIREHVASAGYDPGGMTKAGTSIDGLFWQGRIIRSNDWMDNSVVHFLRHTVAQSEWPQGITLNKYIASLIQVIEDPASGIVIEKRFGQWYLSFVAPAHDTAGADGSGWILVCYSVKYGYWVTGYQPKFGLDHFNLNPAEGERWLCELSNLIR